ncbi:MAG: hypothetical protein NC078_06305 [Ruminococcus sp.]|nr:hypothetical protein [Ruminococcus sp.]
MPYPIITPDYYGDLMDNTNLQNENVEYIVLTSPAAVEYVFKLDHERVIRTLMNHEKPIAYRMTTLQPELEEEYSKKGQELIEKNPILQHYWNLKILTMNIMQDRSFAFEKRMLLLNFAYKTVQGMIDKGKEELIPRFVADYTNAPDHKDVMEYFKDIKPGFGFSLGEAVSLLSALPGSEDMDKLRSTVYKRVGIEDGAKSFTYSDDMYLPMKKAYQEDFLKGREHYMENIMVSYVWSYCMPYADYNMSLWDNFVFFNVLFNLIKVCLTCFTYDSDDKDDDFAFVIKTLDAALQVSRGNTARHIAETLKNQGYNNNGDMAILSMS